MTWPTETSATAGIQEIIATCIDPLSMGDTLIPVFIEMKTMTLRISAAVIDVFGSEVARCTTLARNECMREYLS